MANSIHILMLDDNEQDAQAIVRTLESDGLRFEYERVWTEADYLARLSPDIDVILSECHMPQLTGFRAMQLLAERRLDIPFIAVTMEKDENIMVSCLRQGLTDYVLKDRPARLGAAITRALRERDLRTKQRVTETALQDGERRFRLLFESTPMAMSVVRNGMCLYANPAFARMFGYESVAEVINADVEIFVAPEQREENLRVYPVPPPDFSGRREYEGTALRADGRRFPANVVLQHVNLPDGSAEVAFITDMTEHRRAEAAEEERRTLSAALLDTAIALTSTLDPNVVMARILANVGRVVPHDCANIMLIEQETARVVYWNNYPSELDEFFKHFRLTIDDEPLRTMVTSKLPYIVPDTAAFNKWKHFHETAWIRSHASAPIRVYGQVIGFLNLDSGAPGFFNQQHAERLEVFAYHAAIALENAQLYDELRRYTAHLEQRVDKRTAELYRAKEHVEAILSNSSDAIVVIGLNGAISQVNPAFSALFGYDAEASLGRSLLELAAPSAAAELSKVMDGVMNSHRPQRVEIVARRSDDSHFNADMALAPIMQQLDGDQNTLAGLVASVRDITDRKQIEHELQELNRLKTEFLSTAAHELRTPLTSVRGFSELLLSRPLDTERQQRYLTLINEQAAQLGQLIDDLLDISRLETKRTLTLDMQPVDLGEVLSAVVTPFIEARTKHNVVMNKLESYPLVLGDARRLAQVIKNLMSNAVKYSPNGGTITVTSYLKGNELGVAIADQGIGLAPAQMSHLFEKFYRADASNNAISGTGLGLAISKSIIEMHSGRIWAESQPGAGSTFQFTLPISQAAQPRA